MLCHTQNCADPPIFHTATANIKWVPPLDNCTTAFKWSNLSADGEKFCYMSIAVREYDGHVESQ